MTNFVNSDADRIKAMEYKLEDLEFVIGNAEHKIELGAAESEPALKAVVTRSRNKMASLERGIKRLKK